MMVWAGRDIFRGERFHRGAGQGGKIMENQADESDGALEGGAGDFGGGRRGGGPAGGWARRGGMAINVGLDHKGERTGMVHFQAGAEVGGAAGGEETVPGGGGRDGGRPKPAEAGRAGGEGAGLEDAGAYDRRRVAGLEVRRLMPEDVEAQAGQLGNKQGQRPREPLSKPVLKRAEGGKCFRRINFCKLLQRRGGIAAGVGSGDFAIRCLASRWCWNPAPLGVGLHKASRPGAGAPKESG
jgi:hypothetical protein